MKDKTCTVCKKQIKTNQKFITLEYIGYVHFTCAPEELQKMVAPHKVKQKESV